MYKYRSTFAPPEFKTATDFRRDRLAGAWAHRLSSTTAARLGPDLQKNLQPRVEVLGVHVARERRQLYGQDARAAFEEIREFEPNRAPVSALAAAGGMMPAVPERQQQQLMQLVEVGQARVAEAEDRDPRRRYRTAGRTKAATNAYFRHMLGSYPESTLQLPILEPGDGDTAPATGSPPLTAQDLAATDRQRWTFLPSPAPPPPGARMDWTLAATSSSARTLNNLNKVPEHFLNKSG